MIIEKNCKKNHVSKRMNLLVIQMRGSRQFCFLQKDFTHTKSIKSMKSIKSTKSTKSKQATFTWMFFMRLKSIKSTKCQTSNFLPYRCFYAHKNAAFFVLHAKKAQKAQKAHKKHKNASRPTSDFLPLP